VKNRFRRLNFLAPAVKKRGKKVQQSKLFSARANRAIKSSAASR
jgi:hypothetical protein